MNSPGRFRRSAVEQKCLGAQRCLSDRQQGSSALEQCVEATCCCNNLTDNLVEGNGFKFLSQKHMAVDIAS